MKIPVVQQPSLHEISEELEAYKRWTSAWLRKERPLPPLPAPINPPPPTGIRMCWGFGSRLILAGAAQLGIRRGSPRLQLWSARHRVQTDRCWYEPASCSLNIAFTDLGLALLQMGDVLGAVECLRRSWHVHPCPHSTSFGLSERLWRALEFSPEAEEARTEYERVARRFCQLSGAPRERLRPVQVAKMIVKTLWDERR